MESDTYKNHKLRLQKTVVEIVQCLRANAESYDDARFILTLAQECLEHIIKKELRRLPIASDIDAFSPIAWLSSPTDSPPASE